MEENNTAGQNIQAPPPPAVSRRQMVLILTVVILTLGAVLIYKKTTPAPDKTLQVPATPEIAIPKLNTMRGIITSLREDSLTVASGSATATYNIANLGKVHRLISGEFGSGKVASASAKDLKPGREIYVMADENLQATEIIILK